MPNCSQSDSVPPSSGITLAFLLRWLPCVSWRVVAPFAAAMVSALSAEPAQGLEESDASAIVPLWPGGNPGGWAVEGGEQRDEGKNDGIVRLKNVNAPTLAYFRPENPAAQKPAVIICPGGGYNILAIDHEGWQVADFLADQGIHAFVLKYRLPKEGDPARHTVALQDAQRAVSLVRARAGEWDIAPERIGIMGFSAGGHLTAMTATHFGNRTYPPTDASDEASCRPDFAGLIYPAYLVEKDNESKLSDALVLSDEIPPTFFVHAQNDPVTVESSVRFYLALKERGIPAEMHLYAEGGHGYGFARAKDFPIGSWPQRFAEWVKWVTREH